MDAEPPPEDYVPPYSPAEIKRRFQYLSLACRDYLADWAKVRPMWRLRVDDLVMTNVAKSAMDDIWRYKAYHLRNPNKKSDGVKRAAYFTKWITRFRPIYHDRILSEDGLDAILDKRDSTLTINETFAVHISLSTLATEVAAEKIHLDPDFYANFLYHLHYRNMSEDALIAIYEIIRNAARDETLILKVFRKDAS